MPRPRIKPGGRRTTTSEVDLMMECVEEALTHSQIQAMKKAETEYQAAKKEIETAKAAAAEAMKQAAEAANRLAATPAPVMNNVTRPPASDSPDIIILDDEPPRAKRGPKVVSRQNNLSVASAKPIHARTVAQPAAVTPTQLSPAGTSPRQLLISSPDGSTRQIMTLQYPFTQMVTDTGMTLMARSAAPALNAPGMLQVVTGSGSTPNAPLAGSTAPQQWHITDVQGHTEPKELEIVHGTLGYGVKRGPGGVNVVEPAKKAPKTTGAGRGRGRGRPPNSSLEPNADSGTLVPLDEYYYGKKEGDPAYREEKGEYRFKCWYCHKMLYNNMRIMMHMQGHIDSEKQLNLDLSDLTQCQQCYKQFDTPFEMQCHVEKVHQNKSNVLVCRICEKDVDTQGVLRQHMRQLHNACEMPYICQLCNFRSSIYSDVVDHFKKRHDSSQYMLCLYCLKVFKISMSKMQGWGLTQNYYNHLQKHQSRVNSKKCNSCKLTFLNKAECKTHRNRDHMPNYKGIRANSSASVAVTEQVMIQLPEVYRGAGRNQLKSLNAPAVSKVQELRGLKFNGLRANHVCYECKGRMLIQDHYKKYIECSMCRYATTCSSAYASHMMEVHSGSNVSKQRVAGGLQAKPMARAMYCLCGYSSWYGNSIANHLISCSKRTCYADKPEARWFEYDDEQEEFNPFEPYSEEADSPEKADSPEMDIPSLFGALGLVKKPQRREYTPSPKDPGMEEFNEASSEEVAHEVINSVIDAIFPADAMAEEVVGTILSKVDKATRPKAKQYMAPPAAVRGKDVPKELTGSQKWSTVKLKGPKSPTKYSIFLGGSPKKQKESKDKRDKEEQTRLADTTPSMVTEPLEHSTVDHADEERSMLDDAALPTADDSTVTTAAQDDTSMETDVAEETNEDGIAMETEEKEVLQGDTEVEKEVLEADTEVEKEVLQGDTEVEKEKEVLEAVTEVEKEVLQGDTEVEKEVLQGDTEVEKEVLQGDTEVEKEVLQGDTEVEKEVLQGDTEVEKEVLEADTEVATEERLPDESEDAASDPSGVQNSDPVDEDLGPEQVAQNSAEQCVQEAGETLPGVDEEGKTEDIPMEDSSAVLSQSEKQDLESADGQQGEEAGTAAETEKQEPENTVAEEDSTSVRSGTPLQDEHFDADPVHTAGSHASEEKTVSSEETRSQSVEDSSTLPQPEEKMQPSSEDGSGLAQQPEETDISVASEPRGEGEEGKAPQLLVEPTSVGNGADGKDTEAGSGASADGAAEVMKQLQSSGPNQDVAPGQQPASQGDNESPSSSSHDGSASASRDDARPSSSKDDGVSSSSKDDRDRRRDDYHRSYDRKDDYRRDRDRDRNRDRDRDHRRDRDYDRGYGRDYRRDDRGSRDYDRHGGYRDRHGRYDDRRGDRYHGSSGSRDYHGGSSHRRDSRDRYY